MLLSDHFSLSLLPNELCFSFTGMSVCLFFQTVGDGAESERKEDSDESVYYGRCKAFVFTDKLLISFEFLHFVIILSLIAIQDSE